MVKKDTLLQFGGLFRDRFNCPIVRHTREIGKEIVIQDARNTHNQLRIQIVLAKDTIHIAPITRQMACKPADTPFLTAQFLLD